MLYQGTENCCFGFEVRNEVKEPETKSLLSIRKFSFRIL